MYSFLGFTADAAVAALVGLGGGLVPPAAVAACSAAQVNFYLKYFVKRTVSVI